MKRFAKSVAITLGAPALVAILVLLAVMGQGARAESEPSARQQAMATAAPRILQIRTPLPLLRPPSDLLPGVDTQVQVPTAEPAPSYASCGDLLEGVTWTRIVAQAAEFGACFLTVQTRPAATISFTVNPVIEGTALSVEVLDPDGEQLASGSSDSPESPARLSFTAPPSGIVTIIVYATEEVEFEIKPRMVWYMITLSVCGGELEAGAPRASLVPKGVECWFTYEGVAGRLVTFTMRTDSDELDPMLKLYDAGKQWLATDDDSGGGRNAAIAMVLPSSGAYTIVARDFRRAGTGEFEIEVRDEPARRTPTPTPLPPRPVTVAPPATPAPAGCGGTIGMGATVAGSLLTNNAKCVYSFNGTAGRSVKITLVRTGGRLDPFLELWPASYPSGVRLAHNDDNGAVGSNNSQIDRYRLTANGTYKIVVSSYGGRSSGTYRLTLAQP